MTLRQAVAYFAREAMVNLLRGWKVSALAILTIAASLFLAGVFLLLSSNLRRIVEGWHGESAIVVYLESDASEESAEALEQTIESMPWTLAAEMVSPETARHRFREAFPSMSDLLEGWDKEPLPASLEIRLDGSSVEPDALESWLQTLRANQIVALVDDDRDWLQQLEAVVLVIEGLGLLVGSILLLTAIFTISSIIRLTVYLYRDEIAVMRLVGATEFLIRGPFYTEGLFQGLAGGGIATAALYGAHSLLVKSSSELLLTSILAPRFLPPGQQLLLVALGGLAGLVGALVSLRRESLRAPDITG